MKIIEDKNKDEKLNTKGIMEKEENKEETEIKCTEKSLEKETKTSSCLNNSLNSDSAKDEESGADTEAVDSSLSQGELNGLK